MLRIPFQAIPSKRKKMLGIPFRGTKWKQNLGIPFRSIWRLLRFRLIFLLFFKTDTFCVFLFRSEPRNWLSLSFVDLGMSTFYRGITETVPCPFREIFWERNPLRRVATCCWWAYWSRLTSRSGYRGPRDASSSTSRILSGDYGIIFVKNICTLS